MSDREQRPRRDVLRAAGVTGLVGLAGCATGGIDDGGSGDGSREGGSDGGSSASETLDGKSTGGTATDGGEPSGTITVFHAGSLAAPFERAESAFERRHDVRVNREVQGSIGSMQKITEQGRSADVLAVSDFRLLRDTMMGEFADWYGIFATNAMAIAYTEGSTGSDGFSTDTWWEVLARDDVTFGHSDPAVDPNGFRSVMAMKLGAVPFDGERLFDESTSQRLIERARITSGTETDLIGQLQSGALDYAWEYRSAGASHDVSVVDLQPQVDLGEATDEYAEHYANAAVEAGGRTYTGAPIAYGITVPDVAENPGAGGAWVEFVTTGPGARILEENGLSPVRPMVAPAQAEPAVPGRVAANATFQASLGPLDL